MKKGDNGNKNGFTIIEVALVLAIAGLIFLMVFVALPSLQRQQRDSRRRDDIITFLEAVKKYQTNNRGTLPTNWSEFQSQYVSDLTDPDGSAYTITATGCTTTGASSVCIGSPDLNAMDHRLYVFTKATCDGERAVTVSNPRSVAVLYRLEGSGMYCSNT